MMALGPDAAVCDQRYKHCKNIQIFLVCNTCGFNPLVYNLWPTKFMVQKVEFMIQKKKKKKLQGNSLEYVLSNYYFLSFSQLNKCESWS